MIDEDKATPMKNVSRRKFLSAMGASAAGVLLAPYLKSESVLAYGHDETSVYLAQVALTEVDNYDRLVIKQKVQHLFESIGGISDVVNSGNKVAIKINLTGGSYFANDPKLMGKDIRESMWTHPEVLRATGELIIDGGVQPDNIFIVESLWDDASYYDYGYAEVQQDLGLQMLDLNKADPYDSFIDKEVGDKSSYYSTFKFNRILDEVDVYVSIPKMKHHYDAGVTHSLKNQVGIVPLQYYELEWVTGYRSALHFDGGNILTHLPNSICDLNFSRPVNLAVIDGIMNAVGGEGAWNPTFQPAEYHVLLAGKDPVASDSIASWLMGNDPEAEKIQLPDGIRECNNYLEMLHQKGMGTNQMSEIEVVGDGAHLVTSTRPVREVVIPEDFQLFQNFPNPFNPSTSIKFYLPRSEFVSLKIYDILGKEIDTLVKGIVPAGQHVIHWAANNNSSGVYVYRMRVADFSFSRKMVFQK